MRSSARPTQAVLSLGLSLALTCLACTSMRSDPRQDLVRSLPGVAVDGYRFVAHEDEERVASSLLNPLLRNPVKVGRDTNLVIGYLSVKDKKSGVTRVYRNEIAGTGNGLTLVATDLRTGEVVFRQASSAPPVNICDNETKFNSVGDCLCEKRAPFQCLADRTCETLFPGILCCIKGSDTAIDVHVIITPVFSRQCLIKGVIADVGDMVFTQ